ncbi:hypothetical protein Tco_0173199 [Tanacetum coccineum]
MDLDFAADGNLGDLSGEEAWEAIENFAQGQKEWDNPPNIIFEQELANLNAQAKILFGNEKVWVEMHRGIAWDKWPTRWKISQKRAWPTIEELARYEDEGWNDPAFPEEESLSYKNPDIEQLLGIMESHVGALMKDAISIMKKSEDIFGISSKMKAPATVQNIMPGAFKDLVMNFILTQEERVKQLKKYNRSNWKRFHSNSL